MCGIVGYTGHREAQSVLIEGLRRLEYRGYDSAGLATQAGDRLLVRKKAGRVAGLAGLLSTQPAPGCAGISHTRWATHGGATDRNAHPHMGGDGRLAVVHNGVIENYAELKSELVDRGIRFQSDTDTEVIAHLIAENDHGDLVDAVRRTTSRLKGTYGLAVMSRSSPGTVVGARLGSPLVIGVGNGENFLASDASALAQFTPKVIYLEDRQICALTPDGYHVMDADMSPVTADVKDIDWQTDATDLAGFPHYMLKEIYEQPEALENAMRGRLLDDDATAHFGGLNLRPPRLRQVDRIILTGCG